MRLKNKVILITASTRGIGLACVKACAEEGAAVYMAARNLELAKNEADKLNSKGHKVKYVYNASPTLLCHISDSFLTCGKNTSEIDIYGVNKNIGISI